jgi:enterochelin esterase-like enzyme
MNGRVPHRLWLLAVLLCCIAATTDAASSHAQPQKRAGITLQRLHFEPPALASESMRVTVYLPPRYAAQAAAGRRYPVLYANDGQDMAAVGLQPTLARLYRAHAIEPLIVVAIDMPADRAGAYGLSDRAAARSVVGGSQIGPIGTRAQAYSQWLVTQLVPWVDAHYRTRPAARARTILGWSLGALNAFNLAWQYPEVFGRLGAFSPSFWLAADRTSAAAIQRTRLAQRMVDGGARRPGLMMWFAIGTAEETSDRDGDGVIDAVDDLHDLIDGYDDAGVRLRGLRQLGYSVNLHGASAPARRRDVTLFTLAGGQHNQASWHRMLAPFLRWAYARPTP